MKHNFIVAILLVAFGQLLLCGCSSSSDGGAADVPIDSLRCRLEGIAARAPGRVGIAVISPAGDTLTVNNSCDYQLMSVFKLHEALAVAHVLDMEGVGFDTIIAVDRSELDPDTWSPLYKDHSEARIALSVSALLRYLLIQSDNNVSNLLFARVVDVASCDRFIRRSTGIEDFKLTWTEALMAKDHSRANENRTTPLAAAMLIDKVFTDSLVSEKKQTELQKILIDCQTGTDRITAPIAGVAGVNLAHKTGSGFRSEDGRLMAHNDVGRVMFPDGRSYSLAVFVREFAGSEAEASKVIADVSAVVYEAFVDQRGE